MRGREKVIGHSGVQVFRCSGVREDRSEDRARASNYRRGHRGGFTLVEVLVVMIILAILAAVVVPRVVGRTEDARRSRAVSDVEALGTALDLYKADNGKYPATEQGLQALRESPGDVKNWNGPYLKKALGSDPWGNPYVYSEPGEHNPDSYDLYSMGADGQPGGEGADADVTNWDEQ
jgi:general secretion pathway protein G